MSGSKSGIVNFVGWGPQPLSAEDLLKEGKQELFGVFLRIWFHLTFYKIAKVKAKKIIRKQCEPS